MSDPGRIEFNRPPRIGRSLPEGTVNIPTPPEAQFKGGWLGWLTLIVPMCTGLLSLMAMGLVSILSRGNALFLISSGVMALAMITASLVNLFDRILGDRTRRKEYGQQLVKREEQLRDYNLQQQTVLHYLHPALPQLLEWVRDGSVRLWERRVSDRDFLNVRLGIGARPTSVQIGPVNSDKDLPGLTQARQLAATYALVPDVPDWVELGAVATFGLAGEPDQTNALLRALVCQMAAHHSPDDLKILVTYAPQHAADWHWAGWLPHTRVADGQGNDVPLLACHADQLERLSAFVLDLLKTRDNRRQANKKQSVATSFAPTSGQKAGYMFPNLVWVVEDFELVQDEPAIKKLFEVGAELGIYLIAATPQLSSIPAQCRAMAELLSNGRLRFALAGEGGRQSVLQPDRAETEFCNEFALALTPLQLKGVSEKGDLQKSLRLLDMLGLEVPAGEPFDPLELWNRSSTGQLRVPVGRVFGGQELYLDLSDKGHGPHGLIAGTTGSGKSELLLTIVSALAMNNHPDNLNFVLGDFKGGATFNPFKDLPHVVGMMSDLDLTVVERAMVAILSELKRREHLLKDEGVTHIRDYQKKKPQPKVPMPYLIVIIDEFAEMKDQAPDFMERIINIARTGRTLGVHLILATQRPAGVVSAQLNSNTKYRLCLRVEASEDSSDMLGRNDAALIPSNMPGRAFFKVGSDIFEQFQVARVAVPFAPPDEAQQQAAAPIVMQLDKSWRSSPLSARHWLERLSQARPVEKEGVETLDYDMITRQCVAAARRTVIRNTHRPWLDPLGPLYYLPDIVQERAFNERSLNWPAKPPFGLGNVPVALADYVVDQKQVPLHFNLLTDGSYCISGLGVSGKTTVLRSLITALAVTHSPADVRFYLLDMGNTLRVFSELPHFTTYVPMSEQNRLAEVFAELYEELQRRKTLFANLGLLDFTSYRQSAASQPYLPLVLVAFDNYASIRHNLPFNVEQLKALVREGRAYGMHVALTVERANDFEYGRMNEELFQVSLRQSRDDLAFSVPKNMIGSWNGVPGRGFIRGARNQPPVEIQTVLPWRGPAEEQVKTLEGLVARLQKAAARRPEWTKPALSGPAQAPSLEAIETEAVQPNKYAPGQEAQQALDDALQSDLAAIRQMLAEQSASSSDDHALPASSEPEVPTEAAEIAPLLTPSTTIPGAGRKRVKI